MATDTLEDMARAFARCSTEAERRKVSESIAALLLRSSGARAMVREMLVLRKKLPDRLDDSLQDAVVEYIRNVLPQLREPDAAWGAFKGTVTNIGKRLTSSFYDAERFSESLAGTHRNHRELEADAWGRHEESSAEGRADPEAAFDPSDEIIANIMARNAKATIRNALLESRMKGKNALSWLPKLGRSDGAPPRMPPALPPKAQVAPVRPYRKYDPTPDYERLCEIRDRTGMSVDDFADVLNIGRPRLKSYFNRVCLVHHEVMLRAEQWYREEGKARAARVKKLREAHLPDLLDLWKAKAEIASYTSLALVIGISMATMTRWKNGKQPMHPSHLLDADDKVEAYCRSRRVNKKS